jgi:hypothetical protein
MSGLLKKIVRAAVAQPWEYRGAGAPTEWEFRVSPEEDHFAVYDPRRGTWMIMDASLLCPVAEVGRLDEMNDRTAEWARFPEELEDDEH